MQNRNQWYRPLVISLSVALGGCALVPSKPLVQGPTSAQPIPGPVPAVNGSIFQTVQPINYGYQPLFEDRRPRNIGDTLTINLQENVSASKSSSANASRDGSSSFTATTTPGIYKGCLAMPGLMPAWQGKMHSQEKAEPVRKIPSQVHSR